MIPAAPGPTIDILTPPDARRTQALRMIFAPPSAAAAEADSEIRRFLVRAATQGLDANLLLGAFAESGLMAAALAVISPGRTAAVHLTAASGHAGSHHASVSLLRAIQDQAWERDVVLMQGLLGTAERSQEPAFVQAGFRQLAELVYLERPGRSDSVGPECDLPLSWATYDSASHESFLRALDVTYAETLDCPGLSGLRTTQDVLSGHRATGLFDPSLWFVAERETQPAGILLLAPLGIGGLAEVVYMGVNSRYRGQGIGHALLRRACLETARRGLQGLTLAVDSANVPARRLYHRWGFSEFARRTAWFSVAPR